jgi:para-aminobenzoate synthetase component 1
MGNNASGFGHANIYAVRKIEFTADMLVSSLLGLASTQQVCILDSCGVGHLGSHLMIAGIRALEMHEFSGLSVEETLAILNEKISSPSAAFFSVSYDFGMELQKIRSRHSDIREPDVFLVLFDTLAIHDYDTGESYLTGNESHFDETESMLKNSKFRPDETASAISVSSNFSQAEYISAIETIKEHIRNGDTYQTNLTRQVTAELSSKLTPETIFWRVRKKHPAPFSSFLRRYDSTVISASPERFFQVRGKRVSASPIKGTRPRGSTAEEDSVLRNELMQSEKDRAENTMIVDLLRNDLGRVCEYGSVMVEKLCEIEKHPSLFHLVSTISGKLTNKVGFDEILRALFPCGSITGAPKIRTMQIIDTIEPISRGLSMGAIGYRVPASFGIGESIDLSVAIRTMVVRANKAIFNVGGGIVIDSGPANEYNETTVKSRALLEGLGIEMSELSPETGV